MTSEDGSDNMMADSLDSTTLLELALECEKCLELRDILRAYGVYKQAKCLDCIESKQAPPVAPPVYPRTIICHCDLFMCNCGGEPDEPPDCSSAPYPEPLQIDPSTLPHYRGRGRSVSPRSPEAPWSGSPSGSPVHSPVPKRCRGGSPVHSPGPRLHGVARLPARLYTRRGAAGASSAVF